MEYVSNGRLCAARKRPLAITRRAMIAVAAAAMLFGCKPNDAKKAAGPAPDLTVPPGLEVFFETDQHLHFTIVALGADGKATPLFEGKGRAGFIKAAPIPHPEGSEVRLRFTVPGMPKRGESPEFFHAADDKFVELPKSGDVAEIVYKEGAKAYAITSQGHTTQAKLKQ